MKAIEEIKESGSFRLGSKLASMSSRMMSNTMTIAAQVRDTLDESRKRFMVKLPKYRWNSIHDPIMRALRTNFKLLNDARIILPKIFSIVHKAVYIKKTMSKKAAGHALEYDISARVIAYCLFCRYVM